MSSLPYGDQGERIRELRGGLSQEAFAERLEVDRKTVVRWEKGERLPDGVSLLRLAILFNANVNEILRGGTPAGQTDAAEALLLQNYRQCGAAAKANLLQTSALLAAGLAGPDGGGMSMVNHGDHSVQLGRAGGRANIKIR